MHPNRLQCPHCSVTLRIRDRKHVGQQVDCPDCGQQILVLADGPRDLQFVKPAAAPPDSTEKRSSPAAVATKIPVAVGQSAVELSRVQQWAQSLTTATGVAWSVAAVAGVVLLALAWPFGMEGSNGTSGKEPNANGAPAGSIVKDNAGPNDVPGRQQQQRTANAENVQSRMEQLGRLMMSFVGEHERFPNSASTAAGLTESQRLSWLAELVADMDANAGSQPQWDQAWRDPLNDRFVRRTFPEFLNPDLQQLTGPNRYPATHFVGIAGVGEDGAMLPVGHPRAGIFGVNRRTRLQDIKDGQANTMMVAGVTRNIGGWAGSGTATMRSLTREPYINGPDGFGTGENEGMSVLMADGSVRFVSSNIDPRLMRRMAAMADGFPLDVTIPGEPGDPRPFTQPKPPGDPMAKANGDEPVPQPNEERIAFTEPPVVAPVPPRVIDVVALLSQKILAYEHRQAAPFRVVLREVEEMVGAPIRIDEKQLGAAVDQLNKLITVKKLEETTVGAILQAVVEQVGLAYVVERDGIRIQIESK
jgi:DNA-directed RNA polymerase subunit RPC12/RpoP